MPEPQAARDIWIVLNDLRTSVARMEEQQKAVMSRLDERCEARIERIEKLERGQEDQGKTLDDLKKRIWMSSGAAATLSAIGTYIAAYLGMRHG